MDKGALEAPLFSSRADRLKAPRENYRISRGATDEKDKTSQGDLPLSPHKPKAPTQEFNKPANRLHIRTGGVRSCDRRVFHGIIPVKPLVPLARNNLMRICGKRQLIR